MAARRIAVPLLALAWLAAGCEKMPLAVGQAGQQEEPSLTFRNFKVRASREGRLSWEAEAVRARVFQKEGKAQAEQMLMTYYRDGRAVSHASADRALMNLKTYDVRASGHVVVKGANKVTLSTTRLDWDNARQLATSDAKVRVQRPGVVLTGWGFRADRALDDVRILSDVQAEADSVKQLREESQKVKKP
jgi:LPS export ABC transporter protein LptC